LDDDGKPHPVMYISRLLKNAEKNYSISDKEALAMSWCISQMRPWLYGIEFEVQSDHHALCYIQSLKNPTGRLARIAMKLQEYKYKVSHKRGFCNYITDCLSRLPDEKTEGSEDDLEVPTRSHGTNGGTCDQPNSQARRSE